MTFDLPHASLTFTHRFTGEHGAFLLRVNHDHVDIARKAVAHRLDVPVGVMVVEWPWLRKVEPVKLRRAA